MGDYDFYCDFDVKKHKQTYVNYLEVIIFGDGKIVYAIPSHQEKLIAILMDQMQKTRDEVLAMCPRERYFDFLSWLLEQTGCCSVWDGFVQGSCFTDEQINTLTMLKSENVYHGVVPNK